MKKDRLEMVCEYELVDVRRARTAEEIFALIRPRCPARSHLQLVGSLDEERIRVGISDAALLSSVEAMRNRW